MDSFSGVIKDNQYNVLTDVTIKVYYHDGRGLAVVYSDNSGTVLNQPFVPDTFGLFTFFGVDGAYDVVATASDGRVFLIDNVILINSAETSSATVPDNSIWDTVYRVVSRILSSSGAALIGFIAAGTGAVYRTVQAKLTDTACVLDFGADATGGKDSTAAFQAAAAAFPTANIEIPAGTYLLSSTVSGNFVQRGAVVFTGAGGITGNGIVILGASPVVESMGGSAAPAMLGGQMGTQASPTNISRPQVHFSKWTNAAVLGNGYEGGCGYFETYVVDGSSGEGFVGLTGAIEVLGGTNPQSVAIHASAINHSVAGAATWGGWFTNNSANVAANDTVVGVEIDTVMHANRSHITGGAGVTNAAVGLIINNQSDSVADGINGTAAVWVTGEASAGKTSRWFTGIFIEQNTVVAGDANEAIQINGATTAGNAHCGIRLAGNFTNGLDFSGATFATNALKLPNLTIDLNNNIALAVPSGNGTHVFSTSANTTNSTIQTNGKTGAGVVVSGFLQAQGVGQTAIGSSTAHPVSFQCNNVEAFRLSTAGGTFKTTAANESTGAGSAALGANCPAITATAPYTWIKFLSSDGSSVFIPAWK